MNLVPYEKISSFCSLWDIKDYRSAVSIFLALYCHLFMYHSPPKSNQERNWNPKIIL